MTRSNYSRAWVYQGFTLIELLIVIIILAILAAVMIPQFSSGTDDAKLAALDTTLSNSRSALELYFQHHGHYPSAVTSIGGACSSAGGTTGTGAVNTEAAFLEHLSLYTDAAGEACTISDSNFKYGPYMKKDNLPENPFTDNATTVVVTAGLLGLVGAGITGGWRFDNLTGQFIADHTSYDNR